ncbi:MAG: hypothetical protein LR011_11125 [Verrucomicrobia bacterium]|nr:hypothetical protein [Verrucomicrobiota bacterium]
MNGFQFCLQSPLLRQLSRWVVATSLCAAFMLSGFTLSSNIRYLVIEEPTSVVPIDAGTRFWVTCGQIDRFKYE